LISLNFMAQRSGFPHSHQASANPFRHSDILISGCTITAAWRKMLGNVAANPVTALTRAGRRCCGEPEVRELVRVLLAEAVAVGLAEGARLGPEDVPEDVSAKLAFYDRFRGEVGSSMLYDRLSGRELENELLSGVITKLGRLLGVPTPATRPGTRWSGRWLRPGAPAERGAGLGLPGSSGRD
jgi:Ketopantoate reductase PanE/ApbA C terminal